MPPKQKQKKTTPKNKTIQKNPDQNQPPTTTTKNQTKNPNKNPKTITHQNKQKNPRESSSSMFISMWINQFEVVMNCIYRDSLYLQD